MAKQTDLSAAEGRKTAFHAQPSLMTQCRFQSIRPLKNERQEGPRGDGSPSVRSALTKPLEKRKTTSRTWASGRRLRTSSPQSKRERSGITVDQDDGRALDPRGLGAQQSPQGSARIAALSPAEVHFFDARAHVDLQDALGGALRAADQMPSRPVAIDGGAN